jgi:hypothetical protein
MRWARDWQVKDRHNLAATTAMAAIYCHHHKGRMTSATEHNVAVGDEYFLMRLAEKM